MGCDLAMHPSHATCMCGKFWLFASVHIFHLGHLLSWSPPCSLACVSESVSRVSHDMIYHLTINRATLICDALSRSCKRRAHPVPPWPRSRPLRRHLPRRSQRQSPWTPLLSCSRRSMPPTSPPVSLLQTPLRPAIRATLLCPATLHRAPTPSNLHPITPWAVRTPLFKTESCMWGGCLHALLPHVQRCGRLMCCGLACLVIGDLLAQI